MSVTVVNIGAIDFTDTGKRNTANPNRATGEIGTVRVVLRGVEYVWGPNERKTLPNDIGAEAVAADGRLRVGDTRDGFQGTART